jgi:hypothetical protein
MQSRIEEGCKNLIDGVTLQLQKEKEDKIQEGHRRYLKKLNSIWRMYMSNMMVLSQG